MFGIIDDVTDAVENPSNILPSNINKTEINALINSKNVEIAALNLQLTNLKMRLLKDLNEAYSEIDRLCEENRDLRKCLYKNEAMELR